ncbi:MAG: RpiB/LacA/LacB family sugar-phosphate isomerase, partial [Bdellovibrionota bacterium]
MKRPIAIASDHAGFELKEYLKTQFPDIDWIDEGPASTERTDYPDYAFKVADKVASNQVTCG